MVRLRLVVLVSDPDVPVIVSVDVADSALALTVKVSALVEVAGFGLNAADTPLGRLDTAKFTLPLNPPCGTMAMVLVACCLQ